MSTAGDATRPAGEAAATTPGDGGAANTQKQGATPELTPEQLAAVNARFQRDKDAMLAAERKRWEAEAEQKAKDAELSELERERAERKTLEEKAYWAEQALEVERRRIKLRDAAMAKGLRSTVYVEHVLGDLDEDDEFDAEALADKALALYNADHGGVTQSSAAKKPAAPGGTPNRNAGDLDLSRMTSQEIADHARELGPFKGPAWLNTDVRRFRTAGGRHADER